MAYAYKAIDDLMSEGDQKQNIFASDSPVSGQNQGQQAQGQVKTSIEGELGANASAGSPQMASAPSQTSASASNTSDRAAIKANIGKTSQPKAIGQVQNSLQNANTKLQEEADSYVQQGKAAQNYQIDNADIESAIKGDQTKAGNVTSLLGRQNIDQVQEFMPTDVTVKDAGLLNTDAGLKSLIQRGADPTYTQGMAAFNAQSLRKDPEFINIMQMIQGQQSNLRDKAQDLSQMATQQVKDYGQQQLNAAQDSARNYLTGQSGAIDAANMEEARLANQLLATYRAEGVPDAQEKALEDARAAVEQQLSQVDPRSVGLVREASIDPRSFLNVRGDYGRDDFVSADEAARFNSIMGLLGLTDARSESAPQDLGYSFDKDAMQNALLGEVANLRKEKDVTSKAEMDRILAGAGVRAAKATRDANVYSLNDLAAELASQYSPNLDGSAFDTSLVNPANFIDRKTVNYGAKDVLNAEEVKQLNALAKDLGLNTTYNVGNIPQGPSYTFRNDDYRKAISDAMAKNFQESELERSKAQLKEEAPGLKLESSPNVTQRVQKAGGDTIESLLGLPSRVATPLITGSGRKIRF